MNKIKTKNEMPDFEAGLYDSGRNTADMAVEAVGNDPERFAHLLNICFTSSYPLNMRAARVIELSCEKNPLLILPHLNEVIEKMAKMGTGGVKRGFLKTIANAIDFRLVKDNGTLLQQSFDWLASIKEPISVRYYCITIIEKMCVYEPGLVPEFRSLLEFCLPESSPGLQNKALKTLKRLPKS